MQQKIQLTTQSNATIDSYCNSKSAVAFSLNITHNSFDDISNFCRNFLFLSLIVSWTWWHSKYIDTLLFCRLRRNAAYLM